MITKLEAKVNLDDIPDANKGGNCYQVAFDCLMDLGSNDDNVRLVHGVVTGQGAIEGIEYCHAWVEDGDEVIDGTMPPKYRILPKDIYYALGNVGITKKYSRKQALAKALFTGHYGPWDKVFDDYN